MHKTTVLGRVGKDAEIRQAGTTQVVNFSVCHSEGYKNKEGVKVEKSVWYSCSYFTDKPVIAQYIRKGDNIFVEGTVEPSIYYDNQGKPQIQLGLRVTHIHLCGGSSNQQSQPTSEQNFQSTVGSQATQFEAGDGSGLPF